MATVEWARMSAPDIKEKAEQGALVVLPVASLEQHGPHLPTMVDTRLATEVSIRAATILSSTEPVLVLPCQWMGMSEHHFPFGGTISLDYATFHAVLRCICRSLKADGFKRLFIVNGHGGNTEPLAVSTRELAHEFGMAVVGGTYWLIGAEAIGPVLTTQKNVQHACEAETSMMMAAEPSLVHRGQLEAAARGVMTPNEVAGQASTDGAGIQRFRSFAERAPGTGVKGDPRAATPEKGTALLDGVAAALAAAMANPAIWTAPDAVWEAGRAFGGTG
ncbi:creatininase family protein [Elioraea sp.]|uniref:creatininase family protein n=1 Tax=Elioraea sp. TaxID=2185103 RepID=UPI0025BCAE45|nr:creatininase family protein [Elioraea sp.]